MAVNKKNHIANDIYQMLAVLNDNLEHFKAMDELTLSNAFVFIAQANDILESDLRYKKAQK